MEAIIAEVGKPEVIGFDGGPREVKRNRIGDVRVLAVRRSIDPVQDFAGVFGQLPGIDCFYSEGHALHLPL